MSDRIMTWETLRCVHCNGESFVAVVGLAAQPGKGTTTTPKGWECRQCREIVDIASMQQAAEVLRLEAEVREQQERLAGMKKPRPLTTSAR